MIARRLAWGAAVALALVCLAPSLPAAARDFVQDQAEIFSSATVAQLNQQISNFNAQTGKEIVVMTVPSLGGQTLQAAAQAAFSSQNVNGVLIYIAKDDRKDIIVPGVNEGRAGWFTPDVTRGIRTQMESQFKSEDFDGGIQGAVNSVLAVYRQHVGSLRGGANGGGAIAGSGTNAAASFGGFHLNMFWWIIIIVVGFLILRSILRSLSGPRYMGGQMPPGGMAGGMGGYGPGYYGGGGGGFWSGLLGGLGGAWLGNEIFGQHGGNVGDPNAGGMNQGGNDPSAGGWQSDAGQADMSGSSGGDWSGGGFGGGDSGGGFGGDSGGGGGDSGGGW